MPQPSSERRTRWRVVLRELCSRPRGAHRDLSVKESKIESGENQGCREGRKEEGNFIASPG